MPLSIMNVRCDGEVLANQRRNARRARATLRLVSPRQRESLAQLREEVTKQAKPFAEQRNEPELMEKVTERAPGIAGLFSDL